MIDNDIVIKKAIIRIANEYDLDTEVVESAIKGSEDPLDLDVMVSEGIFCFRGPNDDVKHDNASICLSHKILANIGVAKILIPLMCERIRKWDHEDINVLLSLLKKVVTIMELNPDEYPGLQACSINPAELPSEKIPEDIGDRHYVWAMDKKGMCLVGVDANRLIHIDDLRKGQEDVKLVC
ncbi:hypothetical protein [Methanolobus sp. ZRKC5]|uniref:hypothetical protein n=1 Tax=unclassified Methanolobus TaxID=2629569 RepID=UPI00313D028A